MIGATVAARARVELQAQAGIESRTVAGLMADFDRGYGLAANSVLVIDEAGWSRRARWLAWSRSANRRELADEQGRLVLERGHDATYGRLVSDWAQGREQLAAAAGPDAGEPEAVILAPTREAAAELNVRAQAYARDAGRLGDQALELGGVRFSDGDRILCLENRERDIGVLNGQRGTVTALEPDSFSLRVEIDGHGERVLPGSYIEDGHVGLGYAMTVHKSQGMTADRTYVLGSEDHYRELGYTALSRHRDECRFYVNAGEPAAGQLELEIAGQQRDEVRTRIERALGRERAQQMALDVHETDQALRDLPDTELANRGGRLEGLLASFPLEVKAAELRAIELARQAEHIQGAEQRLQAWRAKREGVGVLDRRGRVEMDERIARDEGVLEHNRVAHSELASEVAAGQMGGEQWLEAHGVELALATVVERELAARRDRALEDAVARAAYEPSEDLLERIGQRPDSLLDAERWGRAAAALESYRQRFDELPGPDRPPARDHEGARAWEHATAQAAPVGPEPLEAVELSDPGPEIDFD